ncbi:MAG: hypothetical protein ACLFRY_12650 [Spirochaetia bacterium]
MKKLLLVLVVVAMLVGVGSNAFAQNLPGVAPQGSNPKNAVHLDLSWLFSGLISGGFGIGGAYERSLTPFLSLKITGGFMSVYGGTYINVLGGVRWYFLHLGVADTAVNGPFVGASGGVGIINFSYYGSSYSGVVPEILFEGGYKFTLMNGGQNGFFVEPVIGYLLAIGAVAAGGFHWGVNIGWAF